MERAYTKIDLMRVMKRFWADKNRGISTKLFASMTGYTLRYLEMVFISEKEPLSEACQIRVSRVMKAHSKGQLRTMESPIDRKRRAEYRPGGEQKPRMVKAVTFGIKDGKISISPGFVNRQDFTRPDLDELLGD